MNIPKNMVIGSELIRLERERQIFDEHWSPKHDDEHSEGELARAAAVYALAGTGAYDMEWAIRVWPWGKKYWKPKDKLKNLIRAGALIAAEIDRIQRAHVQAQEMSRTNG